MTDPDADLREMVARALVATDVRVSENKEADLYGQMADAALAVARPRIWEEAMEVLRECDAAIEAFMKVETDEMGDPVYYDKLEAAQARIRALSPPVKEGAHE